VGQPALSTNQIGPNSLARVAGVSATIGACGFNHVGRLGHPSFGNVLITHPSSRRPRKRFSTADAVGSGAWWPFYRQAKARPLDADEAFQPPPRWKEVVSFAGGVIRWVAERPWGCLVRSEVPAAIPQKLYDGPRHSPERTGRILPTTLPRSVVADLESSGLLVTDERRRCVFLEGVAGQRRHPPAGDRAEARTAAFNYAQPTCGDPLTAFAEPPEGRWGSRVIYVTDAGPGRPHFRRRVPGGLGPGLDSQGRPRLEHVPFGLVQGVRRQESSRRAGDTVRCATLPR